MNNAIEAVKKKALTKIRRFKPEDLGMMYDECRRGRLPIDKNTGAEQFHKEMKALLQLHDTHWVVEDSMEAVAVMFIRSDGWVIEPHVEFFKGVKPSQIYRSYITFFGSLIEQKFKGACVIKSMEAEKKIFDKLVKQKILKYVGDVPNGSPTGETVYLYCQPPIKKETT